jgi:hypothetical protein
VNAKCYAGTFCIILANLGLNAGTAMLQSWFTVLEKNADLKSASLNMRTENVDFTK